MRIFTTIAISLLASSSAWAQQPFWDCINDKSHPNHLDRRDPSRVDMARVVLAEETFDSIVSQIDGLAADPDGTAWVAAQFVSLAMLRPESAQAIAGLLKTSKEGSFERLNLARALVDADTVEAQCQLAKMVEEKTFDLSLRKTVIEAMNFIRIPTLDTFARIKRLSESQDDEDIVAMARLLLQKLRVRGAF